MIVTKLTCCVCNHDEDDFFQLQTAYCETLEVIQEITLSQSRARQPLFDCSHKVLNDEYDTLMQEAEGGKVCFPLVEVDSAGKWRQMRCLSFPHEMSLSFKIKVR
jgi:hypothetical protein